MIRELLVWREHDKIVAALGDFDDELLHVAKTAHGSKAVRGVLKRAGNPAKYQFAALPALNVSRVVHDLAVHVLDRVGGANRPVQHFVDAKTNQHESLAELLTQTRGGARVISGERGCKPLQLSLGKRGTLACQASRARRACRSMGR